MLLSATLLVAFSPHYLNGTLRAAAPIMSYAALNALFPGRFDMDAAGRALLRMPANIRRVWVDVGSDWSSFTGGCGVCKTSYWPGRSSLMAEFAASPDLLVLAFDANPAYAVQLETIPRVVAFSTAVSNAAGSIMFNQFGGPGCSSVLAPNADLRLKDGGSQESNREPSDGDPVLGKGGACTTVRARINVTVVRLEGILAAVPSDVRIELLKVDAQGVDLQVLQGAGAQLSRIDTIIVEAQNASAAGLLYTNASTGEQTVAWMQAQGWRYDAEYSAMEYAALGEVNYVFRQPG